MKTNIFTKNNQTTHTYIIAEAGLNHNGSVETAKQLLLEFLLQWIHYEMGNDTQKTSILIHSHLN